MKNLWLQLLLFGALATMAPAELLTNPGFETGDLSGWSTFGPGWMTDGGEYAFAGNFGAVNQADDSQAGEAWRGVYQDVPVVEDQIYSASVYIRAENVETTYSWLEVKWKDDTGTDIGQLQTVAVDADQPFTRARLPWITAPAGAVTASVSGIVFMPDPPVENADVHAFDNFSFTLVPPNEVPNPGFETGDLEGWSSFGPGWRTGVGDDARSGEYGLVNDVADWQVGEEWRGVFRSVPVTGGETYNAGVFIRAVSVNHSVSWFELQWLDAQDGVISQLQTPLVTADQPFTYVALENIVAPANAVNASIRGIVQMLELPAADDPDFHIFDDFFLTQVPTAAPPLRIEDSGPGNVMVSWPAPAPGFGLEFSPDLDEPEWNPVDILPVATDGRWEVTVPTAAPRAFFRLRKP